MKHLKPFSLIAVIFFIFIACLVFNPGCKHSIKTPDDHVDPGYPDVPLPGYWPTSGWQSTYPERQGMDSGRLADLLEYIRAQNYPIRSVLVIRKGYLVTEAYFHPFQEGFWHIIHSCTKSITSALTGIAIDQGFIENEEKKVLDFFPEYNVANLDQWKESMELQHLLMMASGLNARDSYLYDWEGLHNMEAGSDWTKYVLDLPMASLPGSSFDYCNGASFLIASILQKTTQKNGLEFGHENLFSYLGIPTSLVDWPMSPRGVAIGFGRMRLRPIDMAKFGFLYLHKGIWDGRQLISEEWIDKSTQRQIAANTLSDGYGFQWWIDNQGYFMALGYAGQYIIVNPGENLVVVFTSALPDSNFSIPESLYHQYILDAIRSDQAIADNSQEQARLDNIVRQLANPTPEPVPTLPETAAAISGKIFYFETNPYDWHFIGLTFTPGADEFWLNFSYGDRNLLLPAGLDNVYRVNFQYSYWRAYKGRWENNNTFLIEYQVADYSEWGSLRLSFDENRVTVQFREGQSGAQWEVSANLQEVH
jgi:CubicO group peptidase (beta-lactamase class C family)